LIRAPAVAGRFYPGEPEVLERLAAKLLASPAEGEPRRATAVLAPHAGWIYSGATAGAVYASVIVPIHVILVGPNHTGVGPPLSLWDRGTWEIPGGHIPIDEQMAAVLKESCPDLIPDISAHRYEHCLEVQLGLLKMRREDLRITPVVVGTTRPEAVDALGEALVRTVQASPEPALIVISSDLSHYEPAPTAERKDRMAIAAMEALDSRELRRVVQRERISMCGFAPAVCGLMAARRLGARSGRLIRYSHSGEVSGDDSSVVGYAGMVFS